MYSYVLYVLIGCLCVGLYALEGEKGGLRLFGTHYLRFHNIEFAGLLCCLSQ